MRVIVTGGEGFIGSRLVERLRGGPVAGHDVGVFDIKAQTGPEAGRSYITDVLSGRSVEHALAEMGPVDAMFHLAGPVVEWARKNPGKAAELQLGGTLQVLEACRRFAVPKVILASSFYVYAGASSDAVVNEQTEVDVFRLELFGASKLMSERMVKAYAESYGLEYVILRFGSAYGSSRPGQGSNVVKTFLDLGFGGQPIEVWGHGDRRNQYTFVDDIVEGCVAAMYVRNKTFNLVSPEEMTTGELARLLHRKFGFELVFNEDRKEGPSMAYMLSRKAQKVLAWEPTSLEEGIDVTANVVRNAVTQDG